ncbi:MAG TPA: multicopper oxidase domain-containing protein, partial [Bryobacteraceae bacterium]|nr:multicopper oxidase domain-containing protein [Bryobacteraceae bacterium]
MAGYKARWRRWSGGVFLTAALACTVANDALAAKRQFEMNIEDTRINLVEKQQFHTFAFNGQVPGPLFYVDEGDDIEVTVNNLTALPHTIHWHGLRQIGTWKMDGVPGVTQEAIKPADSFTYKFKA